MGCRWRERRRALGWCRGPSSRDGDLHGCVPALAWGTNHLAPRYASNRRQSPDSACVSTAWHAAGLFFWKASRVHSIGSIIEGISRACLPSSKWATSASSGCSGALRSGLMPRHAPRSRAIFFLMRDLDQLHRLPGVVIGTATPVQHPPAAVPASPDRGSHRAPRRQAPSPAPAIGEVIVVPLGAPLEAMMMRRRPRRLLARAH
jgi:hypothetical protein